MVICYHCKQESSEAHYDRVVNNKTELHGPWGGWRMAGRYLIGPGKHRITPERLRGILWHEDHRKPSRKKNLPMAHIVDITSHPKRMHFTGYGSLAEKADNAG